MSCATEDCDQVERCCLTGGCVVRNPRFVQPTGASELRASAPAENGTKPARTDAHPSTKHKNRKELAYAGRKG